MLSVILTILKILGIILLCVLGLILLLLLLVLFVPIRYSGRGKFEKAPEAEVRVSWLLKLIRVRLNYLNGIDAEAKVGPIRVWSMNTSAESQEAEELPPEEFGSALDEAAESAFPEEPPGPSGPPDGLPAETSAAETVSGETWEHAEPSGRPEEPPEPSEPPKPKKPKKPYTGTPETLDEKFEKIMDKVYGVKDKIDAGIAFLKEESTKRLIALLKKKILRILKELCPTDYGGVLRYGFEDPFTTGQLTSAAAVLYPVYREKIKIEPLFDREEIYADLNLKGRIRLFVAAAAAVQIWFNRDFQKVFKRFRNRNKE